MISEEERDALMLRAFDVEYNRLRDSQVDLFARFAMAVMATSDELFEKCIDGSPELIRQWLEQFSRLGDIGRAVIKPEPVLP